jgi:hypothetical protein
MSVHIVLVLSSYILAVKALSPTSETTSSPTYNPLNYKLCGADDYYCASSYFYSTSASSVNNCASVCIFYRFFFFQAVDSACKCYGNCLELIHDDGSGAPAVDDYYYDYYDPYGSVYAREVQTRQKILTAL